MLRPMAGVAQKYVVGLVALVCWPFGWVIAAVVTNAMLEAAATANLIPVFVVGAPVAAPALTVLLIGAWMLVSSVLAPWVTTKVLLMGMNPATALAQGVGGVAQAAFTGGVGAAVAAVTGGGRCCRCGRRSRGRRSGGGNRVGSARRRLGSNHEHRYWRIVGVLFGAISCRDLPQLQRRPLLHRAARQGLRNNSPHNLQNTPGASGKAGADLVNSRMMMTLIRPPSTSIQCETLTEESLRRRKRRLRPKHGSLRQRGKLASNFSEFLRICDGDEPSASKPPGKNVTPPKNQPPRR